MTVGSLDWCHINFELGAKLDIKSATLLWLAGELVGLQFAGGEASLSVSCEDNEIKDSKRKFQLGPEINFEEPIPLAESVPG
jgi:hypothetical protein